MAQLLLVLVPAPRVFLRVLWFSSLHKNQHFQIPIGPGNSGEKSHPVDSIIYLCYFIYFIKRHSKCLGTIELFFSDGIIPSVKGRETVHCFVKFFIHFCSDVQKTGRSKLGTKAGLQRAISQFAQEKKAEMMKTETGKCLFILETPVFLSW